MSITNRRSFRPSGILQDIKKDDSLRRKDITLLREYDRSTKWIEIGTTGAPAFTGGWVNFSSGSDGNHRAAFMRDAAGVVWLRGLVKSGSIGSGVFTLPVGFRPDFSPGFALGYLRFGAVSNGLFGSLRIGGDGGVVPDVGSNIWFDLACGHWPAEL